MADTQVDASAFDSPFVFSADGHKSLYFTLDQLQSRMCSAHPDQLEVDYTRTMMGFLLFNSRPARIAMIGLGGGSLLKFCYRHLPNSQLTMVEINPKVIALRHEFEVPEDAQRIELVCADGADFVRDAAANNPIGYDVLLVDGFDSEGLAPSLCSQRFYNDCYQALSPQGVMVANLHHDDPKHALFTARIRLAFDGNLLEVASQEKSNSILFARKGSPISIDDIRQSNPLKNFDPEVRTQLQREFARISWAATQVA
ncbi:transferase [Rhodoferax ferrireducens]|uniref:spermine/spermidine synthase domain-containing protein n=1 Tax=Rhodoferax ferrireducens TaxID=192843 RepID=UPI003BB796EF